MKNAFLSLVFALLSIGLQAQFDQNIEYIVITKSDGVVIKGIFKEMTSSEITYFSKGKYHTINRSDVIDFKIKETWPAKEKIDEDRKDYSDQYRIFQSAFPAGKGNHYYRNYDGIVNQVTFGISDQFTLSGGFETLSFFIDEGAPIFFLTPKLSFGQDDLHFSVSTTVFFNESDFVGLANINGTVGNRKNNFTVGLSIPYSNFDLSREMAISLGCLISLNEKLSLTSDLFVVDDIGILVFDAGLRFIADNRIGLDASFIYLEGSNSLFPVLGLSIPFGGKTR